MEIYVVDFEKSVWDSSAGAILREPGVIIRDSDGTGSFSIHEADPAHPGGAYGRYLYAAPGDWMLSIEVDQTIRNVMRSGLFIYGIEGNEGDPGGVLLTQRCKDEGEREPVVLLRSESVFEVATDRENYNDDIVSLTFRGKGPGFRLYFLQLKDQF